MKRWKWFSCLGLVLLLALLLFTTTNISYAEDSNVPEGLSYFVDRQLKTVTIARYRGNDTFLEIPSTIEGYPVTSIGGSAFNGCEILTKLVIPDSVTSIGSHAFAWCNNITEIEIPNSVTSIGDYAFYWCNNLTEIVIPDSVTTIGSSAFFNCTNLTEIVIPNSVTSIGDYTFSGCSSLTEVIIPNSITTIGDCAFSHCTGLTEVIIPDSVTTIGVSAFCYCTSLTEVVIPDSVTYIGEKSFYHCHGLTKVVVPNSITSIEAFVFNDCPLLTEIVIPDSVTSIGYGAFVGCSSLTDIVLPVNVTSIGKHAFYRCSGLTEVVIPNCVTSIGDYAFYWCNNLTEIVIPDSVTTIGDRAFYGCYRLTKLVIPDSVTAIGSSAFAVCEGLTELIIPDSVTTIGDRAFYGCFGLTDVVIPDSVVNIETSAFENCARLTKFSFMGNAPRGDFNLLLNSAVRDYTVYYPAGDSSWDSIVAADYDVKSVTWIPISYRSMANFEKINTYTAGMFIDVVPNSWYEANVIRAYELGLMKGTGGDAFSPTKNITTAEVITMAARIHSIYQTGVADFAQGAPWYQVYVDYAIENDIIAPNSYSNYNALATRADCAAILGASVPESELQAINNITIIPDVTQDSDCGKAVYRLYNAGVLTGTDEYGTFAPANQITRAEVATIATRIVDASLRKTYSIP